MFNFLIKPEMNSLVAVDFLILSESFLWSLQIVKLVITSILFKKHCVAMHVPFNYLPSTIPNQPAQIN